MARTRAKARSPVKRIVPAKVLYPKRKKQKVGATAVACCDQLCPTPSQAGIFVCTANGPGVIVPPQAGGPWMPAINVPAGTFTWVNAGAL